MINPGALVVVLLLVAGFLILTGVYLLAGAAWLLIGAGAFAFSLAVLIARGMANANA